MSNPPFGEIQAQIDAINEQLKDPLMSQEDRAPLIDRMTRLREFRDFTGRQAFGNKAVDEELQAQSAPVEPQA